MEVSQKIVFLFVLSMYIRGKNGDVKIEDLLEPNKLTQKLFHILESSLGVPAMQDHVDLDVEYQTDQRDEHTASADLNQLAGDFGKTVGTFFAASLTLKTELENLYGSFLDTPSVPSCCSSLPSLRYDVRHRDEIDVSTFCHLTAPEHAENAKFPPASFVEVLKKTEASLSASSFPVLQYFGTEEGLLFTYPAKTEVCGTYDPRVRPWYTVTAAPQPKDIVFVIDSSANMFPSEENGVQTSLFALARSAIEHIITALAPSDRMNIVIFSTNVLQLSSVDALYLDDCFKTSVAYGSARNRQSLIELLDKVEKNTEKSSYYTGVERAFQLLENSKASGETRRRVIVFFSGVEPVEAADPDQLYQFIEETNNDKFNGSVSILTYGVGEVSAATGEILIGMTKHGQTTEGKYEVLADGVPLRQQLRSFFNYFIFSNEISSNKPRLSLPYLDAFGGGVVVTVLIPIIPPDQVFRGVIGIDIPLYAILGGVSSDKFGDRNYVFILDRLVQNMLVHPLIPEPTTVRNDPVAVTLHQVERHPSVKPVIAELEDLSNTFQDVTIFENITTAHYKRNGNIFLEGFQSEVINTRFYCKGVEDTDFVMCLVIDSEPFITKFMRKTPIAKDDIKFVYNNVEISAADPAHADKLEFCRYFNVKAVRHHSAVHIPPSSFQDPNFFVNTEESYEKYLKYKNVIVEGETNDIFLDGVVEDVHITGHLDVGSELWGGKLSLTSGDTPQAIYRYIATEKGVFRISPGKRLPKLFDPRERDWYQRSKTNPSITTLSPPYLDVDGAGYVVTLSKAILASPTSTEDIYGVMGIDMPVHYMDYLLRNHSKCHELEYRCFIMSDAGLIIYHNKWVESLWTKLPAIEYSHISEHEKSIAQHMVKAGYMITSTCNSLFEGREHRQSLIVAPKFESNEPGAWYRAIKVNQTNVYLVLHKHNQAPVFAPDCPCTKVEGKAEINQCTQTGEQKCECPCYADSADLNTCLNTYRETDWIPCKPLPSDPWSSAVVKEEVAPTLPTALCVDHYCNTRNSSANCHPYGSCRWCAFTTRGIHVEDQAFCGYLAECWFGQIGSTWLYYTPVKPDPIWPMVVGCLVGIILFVGSIIYIVWRWALALRVLEYYHAVGAIDDKSVDVQPVERRRPSLALQRQNDPRQSLIDDYNSERFSILTEGLDHPDFAAFKSEADLKHITLVAVDANTKPEPVKTVSEALRDAVLEKADRPDIFQKEMHNGKNTFVINKTMEETKAELLRFVDKEKEEMEKKIAQQKFEHEKNMDEADKGTISSVKEEVATYQGSTGTAEEQEQASTGSVPTSIATAEGETKSEVEEEQSTRESVAE